MRRGRMGGEKGSTVLREEVEGGGRIWGRRELVRGGVERGGVERQGGEGDRAGCFQFISVTYCCFSTPCRP